MVAQKLKLACPVLLIISLYFWSSYDFFGIKFDPKPVSDSASPGSSAPWVLFFIQPALKFCSASLKDSSVMNWQNFKRDYLVRFWAPVPAVIAAGVLSAYYFGITGTFWAVTGEFTRWGGHLLQLFGYHPENWGYFKVIHLEGSPLDRIDGVMVIGMFAGCLSAALWANNVKLRMPQHRIRIFQAVTGGSLPALARVWRWAATWQRSLPAFHSFPYMPGFLPWQPPPAPGLGRASPCCRFSASR